MGMLDGILDAVGIGTGGIPWGSIISGGLGFLGQEDTNQMNQDIAANNSAFNAQQAQLNRDFQGGQAQQQMAFQERMAGTAYQRAVPDMIAAGLNPMLAYSQGGAATPSGASGSGSQASAVQPAEMRNAAGAGVAAAFQAAQVDKTAAETRNVEADTELKRAELTPKDYEAGKTTFKPGSYSAAEKDARTRLLEQQASTEMERANLTTEQRNLVKEEVKNAIASNSRIKADTGNIQADTVLKKLAVASAQNVSDFEKKYPQTNQYLGAIGKTIGSARDAFSIGRR